MFFVLPAQAKQSVFPKCQSLIANFFFTSAGRYFLFKRTVPVKFVPFNNNDSAKGTAVPIVCKKMIPLTKKGAISSTKILCEIP